MSSDVPDRDEQIDMLTTEVMTPGTEFYEDLGLARADVRKIVARRYDIGMEYLERQASKEGPQYDD